MGSKGGGSAPSPPDPTATAQAQAQANRVGILSPTGSQYYGNFIANDRPADVSEADWAARPFTDRYRFQVDPEHDVTQIVETPQQTQFRTGTEGLAQSLLGRATTQLGQLPTGPLNFNNATQAVSTVNSPTLQSGFQNSIADAGPITRTVDKSGILPVQQRVNFFGLSQLPGINDFGAEAQNSQNANFQRQLGLLQPQFDLQETRQRQQLADQGIPVGSEAWKEATRQFDQNRQNALLSAAQDAINQGGAEQSRLFGLAMQARGQGTQERLAQAQYGLGAQSQLFGQRATEAGFGNQAQAQQFGQNTAQLQAYNDAINMANQVAQQNFANQLTSANFQNSSRSRDINEQMLQRGNSFNELAALLGGPQIGAPSAINPAPVDVAGPQALAYQSQLAQYNANQARNAGVAGGLFGLGGSLLGAGVMPGGFLR